MLLFTSAVPSIFTAGCDEAWVLGRTQIIFNRDNGLRERTSGEVAHKSNALASNPRLG
jgi:hypothetical protein